jgi:hypothetical protein
MPVRSLVRPCVQWQTFIYDEEGLRIGKIGGNPVAKLHSCSSMKWTSQSDKGKSDVLLWKCEASEATPAVGSLGHRWRYSAIPNSCGSL